MSGTQARGRRTGMVAALGVIAVAASGCGFQGLNSLPIPGAQGTDRGDYTISALIPSAAGLVNNAPVMMDDSTIGSVGDITVQDWKAKVQIRLKQGTQVPRGSYVMVGMTSVLGSSHLQVVQPENGAGKGMMAAGESIPLTKCPEQKNITTEPGTPTVPDINAAQQVAACTYPSTEQVLSSLSVVLNGGGVNQLGDIVHELNKVFVGRDETIRKLLPRLNTLVADLDRQKDNIISAIEGLDRLSATINDQRPTVERALQQGPEILQLLVDQRPHLTGALDALAKLSTTANDIVTASDAQIKSIVKDLAPFFDHLANSGPALPQALGWGLTFPFIEDKISTIVRGDYINGDLVLDLTANRLMKGMFSSIGFVGPGAVVGAPAGAAGRGLNPFTAPLTPGGDLQRKDGSDPTRPSPNKTPAKQTTTTKPTKTQQEGGR